MKYPALDEAIRKRYIEPTKRPAGEFIGAELELPIVNRAPAPVDFSVIHRLTDAFMEKFAFEAVAIDDDGFVSSAEDPKTHDNLSYDCSYNTIEFSFGKEKDIHILQKRFLEYYRFVKEFLEKENHTLTGMGLNPRRDVNLNIPVPNGRYRMLLHHLESYTKYEGQLLFHHIPNFGLMSCASQTHVDVSEIEIVQAINAFHKLEPFKALLFANSPMGDLLCARDYLWKNSLHGLNPHNVDGYDKELASIDEVVSYIRSMSIYCLDRDGKYINFAPTRLDDYFAERSVTGEYFNGKGYETIEFAPDLSDLSYLRSFKFVDLTFRGTLELRSVCEQPVSEIFAPQAFHAGVKKNLGEISRYLDSLSDFYELGYTSEELREFFVRRKLPGFFDEKRAASVITDILDIAKEGLRQRGFGEEDLLDPLYVRARSLLSPAREMVEGIEGGKTLEYYIDRFGEI